MKERTTIKIISVMLVTVSVFLFVATNQNITLRQQLKLAQQRAMLAEDSARRKQANIDMLMRQLDVAIRESNRLRELHGEMKP